MGGSFIKEADNVAKDILKDFREGIIWVGRLFLGNNISPSETYFHRLFVSVYFHRRWNPNVAPVARPQRLHRQVVELLRQDRHFHRSRQSRRPVSLRSACPAAYSRYPKEMVHSRIRTAICFLSMTSTECFTTFSHRYSSNYCIFHNSRCQIPYASFRYFFVTNCS